jgi:hypothetical protein
VIIIILTLNNRTHCEGAQIINGSTPDCGIITVLGADWHQRANAGASFMLTAIIVAVVVIGLLVGLIMSLRSSAKTGIPSQDVIDRASERARKLNSEED